MGSNNKSKKFTEDPYCQEQAKREHSRKNKNALIGSIVMTLKAFNQCLNEKKNIKQRSSFQRFLFDQITGKDYLCRKYLESRDL